MEIANNAPLVSVIVPAYNSEKYIGDALGSLMRQTVSNIEILVVDDGSTDGTARVAESYARRDSRIRVTRRGSASGRPACARNDGLRVARGEYIALLDADDIATPNRLASSINAMRKTGARFAFADYRRMHQNTGTVERKGVLETAGFLARAAFYMSPAAGNVYLCTPGLPAFLLTFTAVHTPTVVFRRDLLLEEPDWFDESIVCYEDVDLWLRLATHTQFVFVNEVHGLYRRHAASLTQRYHLSIKRDGITVRKAHLQRLAPDLSPEETAAAKRTVADVLWDISYANWCLGHHRVAIVGFAESWRTVPTWRAASGFVKAFFPRNLAISLMSPTSHPRVTLNLAADQASSVARMTR